MRKVGIVFQGLVGQVRFLTAFAVALRRDQSTDGGMRARFLAPLVVMKMGAVLPTYSRMEGSCIPHTVLPKGGCQGS